MPELKKIGLVYHPLNERAMSQAQKLSELLSTLKRECWISSAWEPADMRAKIPDTDLIITCGGDGTILRVAQIAVDSGIPILGINLGRLGFMTELSTDEVEKMLPEVLDGGGWLEERAMLDVDLHQVSHRRTTRHFFALNDIVMARGEIARIIHITSQIDGRHFTTYRADGVVMSTATGSTGYSLAAYGPVLHPESTEFLLTPIMPHLTLHYPLVLPAATKVKLILHTAHLATLSIDGHTAVPLGDGDNITVESSSLKTKFLRLKDRDYFYRTLDQKLKEKP
jgi:NAD+ kinase